MENNAPQRPANPWRFRIRSLFLVALMVAIALSAFRYGRDVGYSEGERIGFAEGLSAKPYVKTYRVSDLVRPTPSAGGVAFANFEPLMNEILTEVQPASWDGAGGPASLAPYPQNLSLVVSQTSRGHDELAEFLETKREERLNEVLGEAEIR